MLRQRLTDDMKAALKAGEKDRLGTIRLVIAAVKAADIEPGAKGEIDDAGIVAVMQRMLKQRRDSVEQYTKGGRADLAAKEEAEIAIIETYLPRQLDEATVRTAIADAIRETGAAGPKDMGRVMGLLKQRHGGAMDFGKASGLVKEALAKG
jgi:uncharacterized protein YqeY